MSASKSVVTRRNRNVGGRQVAVVTVNVRRLDRDSQTGIQRAWQKRFATPDEIPDMVILDLRKVTAAEDVGSDYTGLAARCFKHLRQIKPGVCGAVCVPRVSLLETFRIQGLSGRLRVATSLAALLDEFAAAWEPTVSRPSATVVVCPKCGHRFSRSQ